MAVKEVLAVFFFVLFIERGILADEQSRQKRCIVIQKQSGGGGESEADDDDDYRRPQPKQPSSDRLKNRDTAYGDAENIPPELLKYRILPSGANNEYKLKKRLFRKYL